jgi:hypothetical protein
MSGSFNYEQVGLQQVSEAIATLFGPTATPAQRTQADVWLRGLQKSPRGWALVSSLLESTVYEMQYIGSVILIDGVLAHRAPTSTAANDETSIAYILHLGQQIESRRGTAGEAGQRGLANRLQTVLRNVFIAAAKLALVANGRSIHVLLQSLGMHQPLVTCLQLQALADQMTLTLRSAKTARKKKKLSAALQVHALQVCAVLQKFAKLAGWGNTKDLQVCALVVSTLNAWLPFLSSLHETWVVLELVCGLFSNPQTSSTAIAQCLCSIIKSPAWTANDSKYIPIIGKCILGVSQELKQQDIARAVDIANVACTFGEVFMAYIVEPNDRFQCVGLLHVFLACTGHSYVGISDLSLEVWHVLADMPPQQRAAVGGLFSKLLATCLKQAVQRTAENTGGVEQDEWNKYRRGIASTLVIIAESMTYVQYLTALVSVLRGAASWKEVEVCVFALSAVAAALAEEEEQPHAPASALFAQVLQQHFQASLSEQPAFLHPSVVTATCDLLGKSMFVLKTNQQMVMFALQYLAQASTAPSAAPAFLQVCGHQKQLLCKAPVLSQLIQQVLGQDVKTNNNNTDKGNKNSCNDFYKGLSILVTELARTEPQQAKQCLELLAGPAVNGLRRSLQAQASNSGFASASAIFSCEVEIWILASLASGQHAVSISTDLQMVSQHPFLNMLNMLTQLLSKVNVNMCNDEFMNGLVMLYSHSIECFGKVLQPQAVNAMLQQTTSFFKLAATVGMMEVLQAAIDIFSWLGKQNNSQQQQLQQQWFNVVFNAFRDTVQVVARHVEENKSNCEPELLVAFYDMCSRVLQSCPVLFCVNDQALAMLQLCSNLAIHTLTAMSFTKTTLAVCKFMKTITLKQQPLLHQHAQQYIHGLLKQLPNLIETDLVADTLRMCLLACGKRASEVAFGGCTLLQGGLSLGTDNDKIDTRYRN